MIYLNLIKLPFNLCNYSRLVPPPGIIFKSVAHNKAFMLIKLKDLLFLGLLTNFTLIAKDKRPKAIKTALNKIMDVHHLFFN